MELKDIKSIHFTGIKGIAMTSLALCAQDLNIKISGSDLKEIFVTDEILKERKIDWKEGFKDKNWKEKPDLLITTGAHGGFKNQEVISAKKSKIPVISQAEALNLFSQGKEMISVCGVGGKTTICSIIASIFELNNLNISYAIGVGKIYPIGYGGKYSKLSKYFISEADEFVVSPGSDNRPKFSLLSPKIVVVTNIEHDHPDIYPSIKDTKNTFTNFLGNIPSNGLLVALNDNKNTKEVIKKLKNVNIQTFGFSEGSDWQIIATQISGKTQKVAFRDNKNNQYSMNLKIPGKYNALNALAAFIVANFVGIDIQKTIGALEKFEGTQRRFEKIGVSKKGILVFDDYAHHPKEIINVIKTAKELYPEKRIISIFQPHTYSRTKILFNEFSKSFKQSDIVLIMDIYSSARELKDSSVSSALLAGEIAKYKSKVFYTGNHKKTIDWLKKNVKKNDFVITLGAGNIFYLDREILKI